MFRIIVLIGMILFSPVLAMQKQGGADYWYQEKNRLLTDLQALGGVVQSNKKCNVPSMCNNKNNCQAVITGINNAPNAAAVATALSNSCLVLCKVDNNCLHQQFDALDNWLNGQRVMQFQQEIARQRGKKQQYKGQVRNLQAQLNQANQNLNAIDQRLGGFLGEFHIHFDQQPADVVAGIHDKLTQLFGDSRGLRDQLNTLNQRIRERDEQIRENQLAIEELNLRIAQLIQEGRAKDEEINRLREQIQDYERNIDRLRAEISAQQEEIARLNGEIEDLNREFNTLLDSTMQLEGIVQDFGLSLREYTGQLQNLNGDLRGKIEQLTRITNLMKTDLTRQAEDAKQRHQEMLDMLNTAIQELTVQADRAREESRRLQDILGKM